MSDNNNSSDDESPNERTKRRSAVADMLDERHDESESEPPSADSSTQEIENIQNAWKQGTVYLSEDLDTELNAAYRDLQEALEGEITNVQKTRHLYPLVLWLGIREMRDMSTGDIIRTLDDIDPDLDQYLQ